MFDQGWSWTLWEGRSLGTGLDSPALHHQLEEAIIIPYIRTNSKNHDIYSVIYTFVRQCRQFFHVLYLFNFKGPFPHEFFLLQWVRKLHFSSYIICLLVYFIHFIPKNCMYRKCMFFLAVDSIVSKMSTKWIKNFEADFIQCSHFCSRNILIQIRTQMSTYLIRRCLICIFKHNISENL